MKTSSGLAHGLGGVSYVKSGARYEDNVWKFSGDLNGNFFDLTCKTHGRMI